jgi:hypothetical protein
MTNKQPQVRQIDTKLVKELLKACPIEVQQYVKSLEGVYEANKRTLSLAISKLKEKTTKP